MHGLTGPALAVDTACSSGLVAVAQAYSALLMGQCAAALAAAANLLLSPFTHASFAIAGKHQMHALCLVPWVIFSFLVQLDHHTAAKQ